MKNNFKNKYSFDERVQESRNIKEKYPDRVPIIVQKNPYCDVPDIDKFKYLVPKEMNMAQFLFVIRKRIKINSSTSLFIIVDNGLVGSSINISSIYEDKKDNDGFLYVTYTTENTFG